MDKKSDNLKIDKSQLSVVSLSDLPDDKDYWISRTPIKRLQHIEVLRRINYGHVATSGLQRILEVVER